MARLERLERVADLHGRTDLPVLFTILIAGKEGAPLWGRAAQAKRSRAMERSVNRTDIPALDTPPAEGPHPTLRARHVAANGAAIVISAGRSEECRVGNGRSSRGRSGCVRID